MHTNETKIWDPLIRTTHWLLVLAFFIAYLTGGEPEWLHVWAGYLVAAIVVVRVVWGVIGPHHARFWNFVRGPAAVLGYLKDLTRLRSQRYLGHSPAGGAMIVALLVSLAGTTLAGMMLLAQTAGEGPLSSWVQPLPKPQASVASNPNGEAPVQKKRHRKPRSVWKEVHEIFANLTLVLVCMHVAGVLLASLAHGENLIRAMFSGYKRSQD